MPPDTTLSILFLWHQHQPLYKDGLKNRYEMPWVRLHATKDYLDMVTLLDEFPKIKANFNLVPSLLTQLDDYATGQAQDRFVEVTLKSPGTLTFDDRQFLLQNFFMAHWEHMIDPYPRYRELLDKRGRMTTSESLSRTQNYFKEQDWRDLQTWFNLSWFDPLWRERDPFIRHLFEKGKQFTEEDKKGLIDRQMEFCKQVALKHKALQDRGQIEVTTTPFYHPILPLLCDSDAARMALPQMSLPAHRFQHIDDAREQLRRAVEDYKGRFGQAPRGLWPSEGSVSDEALRQIAEAGLRWIGTDEGILWKSLAATSLSRERLYQAYQVKAGEKHLNMFFRDHELSDAIGFVYASWDPKAAAHDFIRRLQRIRMSVSGIIDHPVVPIILDGENCWEYYKDDGLPFLRALYQQLSDEDTLETVRGTDFLDRTPTYPTLDHIWSGSWINSNFAIWIGHAEDNKAWDLLWRTRQFLVDTVREHPELKGTPEIQQAWEEIYIAEGSDWCWWYGEDHSSANDGTFDYLFRRHLMNVYVLTGVKPPDDLHTPIKTKKGEVLIQPPVDFISPKIDGKVTSYFEWRAAGYYITEPGTTGTMQKAENLIKQIYFGFDLLHLYLRFDFSTKMSPATVKGLHFRLTLEATVKTEFTFELTPDGDVQPQNPDVYGKFFKNLEICLPLKSLPNADRKPFGLTVTVIKDNTEQEHWPLHTSIQIPFPSETIFAFNWQA